MAKAERPKSAMAILPVRPCRGSGKAAQVAFSPESRDGNSSIPTVNHFLGDLRIPKMHILQNLFQESSVKYTTFRIAVLQLLAFAIVSVHGIVMNEQISRL